MELHYFLVPLVAAVAVYLETPPVVDFLSIKTAHQHKHQLQRVSHSTHLPHPPNLQQLQPFHLVEILDQHLVILVQRLVYSAKREV